MCNGCHAKSLRLSRQEKEISKLSKALKRATGRLNRGRTIADILDGQAAIKTADTIINGKWI